METKLHITPIINSLYRFPILLVSLVRGKNNNIYLKNNFNLAIQIVNKLRWNGGRDEKGKRKRMPWLIIEKKKNKIGGAWFVSLFLIFLRVFYVFMCNFFLFCNCLHTSFFIVFFPFLLLFCSVLFLFFLSFFSFFFYFSLFLLCFFVFFLSFYLFFILFSILSSLFYFFSFFHFFVFFLFFRTKFGSDKCDCSLGNGRDWVNYLECVQHLWCKQKKGDVRRD